MKDRFSSPREKARAYSAEGAVGRRIRESADPAANQPPTLPEPSPETPTLDVPGVVSIPLSEIRVSYTHSGGPGGQNVNKTSSKARIFWKLTGGRLSPEVVERFRKLYPSYVTTNDEVVISNQEYRDQPKNREACLNKLRDMIQNAAKKPKKRIPTKPTHGSVLRRLDAKKRLSAKKKERSRRDFD